jgi:hypothetical protein
VAIGTASFMEPACAAQVIEGIKGYCGRRRIMDVKDLVGSLE